MFTITSVFAYSCCTCSAVFVYSCYTCSADFVQESYERARDLLTRHRSELNLLAEALLEFETLDADEVKLVLTSRSLHALRAKRAKEEPSKPPSTPQPGNKTLAKPALVDSKIPVQLKEA